MEASGRRSPGCEARGLTRPRFTRTVRDDARYQLICAHALREMCRSAGWRTAELGGALNPGAERSVYRGEQMTMVSVAAAAHSAPGAAFSALPIALLLIPALSVGIRR